MKKLVLIPTFLLLCLGVALAQSHGTLDDKTLKEIRSSFNCEGSTKAIQNAVTNAKSLRELALNRSLQGSIDHLDSYRVTVSGITDQQQSGRCWMFTSMNTLRPIVMKKFNISSFDFSHNYNYFWDIFEKSNLFLNNIIATADKDYMDREVVFYFKSPVNDGGVWNSFYNVGIKYGVVPASVMPETTMSNKTNELIKVVNEKLRGEAYRIRTMIGNKASNTAVHEAKIKALKEVYRILALSLGEPPMTFTWRYEDKDGQVSEAKQYTPKEFFAAIVPEFKSTDMVMIMNDPTREYFKMYEIKNYRNVEEGINWTYLNLPNAEIKKFAIASIKNNEAMYASCDVGKQHNRKTGVMAMNMYDYADLFGVSFDMDKKARILTRQSGSSHAMTLIGVDLNKAGQSVTWELENSWGADYGNHGYLTFTDGWFDNYMFRLVINKKYLDAKSKKASEQTPIALPVWDYMF